MGTKEEAVKKVKQNLRIVKVTCTRSVKGRNGDTFVGFSAAWDSVQNDPGGMGVDHELITSDREIAPNGFTLQEAKIAQYMLAMRVDIAAAESAVATNGISPEEGARLVNNAKANYQTLVNRAFPEAGKVDPTT